jgi:hypothetical protein
MFGELINHVDRASARAAAWYPDPDGVYPYRYWDGARWTDAIYDQGNVSSAPLGSREGAKPGFPSGGFWYPDPTRRHDYRYWDGHSWTDHVSDNGSQGSDPYPGDQIPT